MGSPSPAPERDVPKKKKKKDKRKSRSRSPKKSRKDKIDKIDKIESKNGYTSDDKDLDDAKKFQKRTPVISGTSKSPSKSPSQSLPKSPTNRSPIRKKRRSRSRSTSASRRRRRSPLEQLDEFGRVISLRKKDMESLERERERKQRPVDIYDKRDDMLRRKLVFF